MMIFSHGYSSEVDGRGTRLIFYLKGCNFRCDWCGAPESISPQLELMRYPARTVTCGEEVTCEWILNKALRCKNLVDGVTFGGGEPTLQADELIMLLQELQANNIHTALESNASTPAYLQAAQYTDQLFSDLKTLSEELFTARINPDPVLLANTLDNLQIAARTHRDLTIRIPVITGLNDHDSEQQKIAVFLQKIKESGGKFKLELLRQHHLAEPKYDALGRPSKCRNVQPPTDRIMEKFNSLLSQHHIKVI